jgi:hypothetical protein
LCVSRQNSNTRPPPLDFLSLSLSLVQAMNVVKRLAHAVAVWLVLHALGAGLERGETGGVRVGLGRAWDWPPHRFRPRSGGAARAPQCGGAGPRRERRGERAERETTGTRPRTPSHRAPAALSPQAALPPPSLSLSSAPLLSFSSHLVRQQVLGAGRLAPLLQHRLGAHRVVRHCEAG